MLPTSIYSIISRIQEQLHQHTTTDESVPLQLIEDTCHVVRLALLSKSNNKSSFYQTICCLPIECEDVTCDGMLLESVKVIRPPSFVTDVTPKVANVSKSAKETYFYLGKEKAALSKGRYAQLIKQKQFSVFENGMVVVFDEDPTEFVCFSAVYENPYDEKIVSCNEGINSFEDMPYPIESSLVIQLEDIVFRKLINQTNGANTKDDNKNTITP